MAARNRFFRDPSDRQIDRLFKQNHREQKRQPLTVENVIARRVLAALGITAGLVAGGVGGALVAAYRLGNEHDTSIEQPTPAEPVNDSSFSGNVLLSNSVTINYEAVSEVHCFPVTEGPAMLDADISMLSTDASSNVQSTVTQTIGLPNSQTTCEAAFMQLQTTDIHAAITRLAMTTYGG